MVTSYTDDIEAITEISHHISISQSSAAIASSNYKSIGASAPAQGIGTGTTIENIIA